MSVYLRQIAGSVKFDGTPTIQARLTRSEYLIAPVGTSANSLDGKVVDVYKNSHTRNFKKNLMYVMLSRMACRF
jgi:hypothetical protein